MNFGIYLIHYLTEVVVVIGKIVMVSLNNQYLSEVVGFHPGFVALIKSFQVVDPYRTFIFAASFLDLIHKCGH